ncbi:trafficking protein particle complex subunit 4 [Cimex lectularius]|uniref:Trafficking protein particle complex subunit n=1 Tax=Cimex lectularius TaxID=79782 RepID=A0A8I6RPL1_CIMLE|nr:trafficking protein particle complex subunit 4 [Cimex lectularius]
MVIYGVYIVSKSGGLIFNLDLDHNVPNVVNECTFKSPEEVDFKLVNENKRVVVSFGQHDGVMVGHVLIEINGIVVTGTQLDDGRDAFEVIEDASNYPLTLKFTKPKVTTNEKIFLASMFYPLFALASQLSPEPKSSGIEVLEADTFKLECFQTLTGVKFMIISEPGQTGLDTILRKIYELYADYALKNPFYSLDMPIRCELFDSNLKALLDQAEKSHVTNI